MRKTIITFAVLLIAGTVAADAVPSDVADRFAEANRLYEQRDYDSAVTIYQSILDQNKVSAELYYNLGNAHFKSGDIGHAVLNYLRAKRLDPSDEDIQNNLEFARRFAQVEMEGVELNPITAFFESTVEPYRLRTLAWMSSLLFLLFIGALIARYGLGFRMMWVRVGVIVTLLLMLTSAGLTTFKYRTAYLTERVVIVAEESIVRNGPTENADIEFRGAPGLVAEVLSRSGKYYNVLFENKRRGWIHRDLVAEV